MPITHRSNFTILSILLVSFFSFKVNNLQAQHTEAKFGVKGGLNLTNFYQGDQLSDENVKVGFNVGVFLKAPVIEDVFSIQPELLYSLKGSQVNYTTPLGLGGSGKYRYDFGYIDLPVLAVVNLGKLNLHAGPYGGFLLDVKVKDVDGNGTVKGMTELDKDKFNTIDYGLVGGIGFDFEGATIGLRYNMGLNEVGKDGTLAGNALKNSKNSVFQAYFGFTF
jgi:hypothetical protein